MIIKGNTFVFGDHVNTDEIIAGRFLSTSSAEALARNLMEDVRPGFGRCPDLAGSIFVAGVNFGCGSSREHAPMAIKAAGVAAVIARSFARIFLRNAINIGLPIVELGPAKEIVEGEIVEVDLAGGKVRNVTRGKEYPFTPYPPFLQDIIRSGGWLEYAMARRSNSAGRE